MTKTETTAGTPIVEFTPDEWESYVADELRRAFGLESVESFQAAYAAGEVDEDDPETAAIVSLLSIGQNGQLAA